MPRRDDHLPDDAVLLTTQQACVMLNVDDKALAALRDAGEVEAFRLTAAGGRGAWRYKRASLEGWVRRRRPGEVVDLSALDARESLS